MLFTFLCMDNTNFFMYGQFYFTCMDNFYFLVYRQILFHCMDCMDIFFLRTTEAGDSSRGGRGVGGSQTTVGEELVAGTSRIRGEGA